MFKFFETDEHDEGLIATVKSLDTTSSDLSTYMRLAGVWHCRWRGGAGLQDQPHLHNAWLQKHASKSSSDHHALEVSKTLIRIQ